MYLVYTDEIYEGDVILERTVIPSYWGHFKLVVFLLMLKSCLCHLSCLCSRAWLGQCLSVFLPSVDLLTLVRAFMFTSRIIAI